MDNSGPHAAIHAAHRRFRKNCRGEFRREVDLDHDGDAQSVTWMFYVPPADAAGQLTETVRLPLITAHRSGRATTASETAAKEQADKPAAEPASRPLSWPRRLGAAIEGVPRRVGGLFRRRDAHPGSPTERAP